MMKEARNYIARECPADPCPTHPATGIAPQFSKGVWTTKAKCAMHWTNMMAGLLVEQGSVVANTMHTQIHKKDALGICKMTHA